MRVCGILVTSVINRLAPLALFLAVVVLPTSLGAESEIRVFPDQYLVEPLVLSSALGGSSRAAAKLTQAGLVVKQEIEGLLLVEPLIKTAALSTAPNGTVSYDPAKDLCQKLLKQGAVRDCSPNYELRTMSHPNDPRQSELWGFSAQNGIDAAAAWDISTGSEEVVIAVIDTGVDYTHPDLVDNMWRNPGEIAGNGLDDDGNGYVDDVYGYSALHGGDPMDLNGHGTHVAGTIAARGNNAIGIAGVNWRARIMALQFLDANGSGSLSGAVKAINYMVAMKKRGVNIRVSNNSWGGGAYSSILHNAIRSAHQAGIVFVAAAGNAANDNDRKASYPGNYDVPNLVSVAAIDRQQNLANFSNFGANSVHIAAPGVAILSTHTQNRYRSLSGTSMAAPHVAGALALLFSVRPDLSPSEALEKLYASGKSLATLNGVVRGGRTLNAGRLLRGEYAALPQPQPAGPQCTYQIQEIPFNPDYSADQAPIVLQADEMNYTRQDLGFNFPFFGRDITGIHLSPNGVLYMAAPPTGMDYRAGSTAPENALAALQMDLFANQDPQGVRVAAAPGRLVLYWQGLHYARRDLGPIEVRAVLKADGSIEVFVDYQDQALDALVQSTALIGLRGAREEETFTYAAKDARIRKGTAVRFQPQCVTQPPALVREVGVFGINKAGQANRRNVIPRRPLQINVAGEGSGSFNVQARLGGRLCATATVLSLKEGRGSLSGVFPRVSRKIHRVKFTVAGSSKAIQIRHGLKPFKAPPTRGRVRARQLSRYCNLLMKSLQ